MIITYKVLSTKNYKTQAKYEEKKKEYTYNTYQSFYL